MGCSSSQQTESLGGNGKVFRVTDLSGRGDESRSKKLEVTCQDLILHQNGEELIRWPLWCLRHYGCDRDLLIFESGRRCPTGPGTFAFRCRRAEALFDLLHQSVVRYGHSHNSQLPVANGLNPSVQSVVLRESFQEIPAKENTTAMNGTKPTYVNDPGRLKYYNVLGSWRDDVCRTDDYADISFSLKENYVFAEREFVTRSHSYVNVGSKGRLQPPPYVNFPVNTNGRASVNVPVKIQTPFPIQHRKSFHDCDDSGYLNPRRDLLVVGDEVEILASS